jgi:hypothetical protein
LDRWSTEIADLSLQKTRERRYSDGTLSVDGGLAQHLRVEETEALLGPSWLTIRSNGRIGSTGIARAENQQCTDCPTVYGKSQQAGVQEEL